MRLIFLLLLSFTTAWSIAQTASPSTGCVPLDVAFTGPGSTNLFWDFGDGATSTLDNPQHVYVSPGTYTAEVFQEPDRTSLGTITITAYPTPSITLTQDTSRGCAPFEVNFDANVNIDPSINIVSYTWAFGDGSSANGASVSNTYFQAGTRDVSVQLVTDFLNCNVTETFDDAVTVETPPSVSFTTVPSPPQSCNLPLNVSVNNTTTGRDPITYAWDFGNGQTSTDINPPQITYSTGGSFDLSLTATDELGCVATTTTPVTAGPPNPNFDLPDTVCLDVEYLVRADGAGNVYTWTYGPNISATGSSGPVQRLIFRTPGPTTVNLLVENTDDMCQADTTRNIFVQDYRVNATSTPSYFCDSPFDITYSVLNTDADQITYFLTTNNQPTSVRDTTFGYVVGRGGEYGQTFLSVIETPISVRSTAGCVADTIVLDTIDIPNALFMPDLAEGCAPLLVTFADSIRSTQPITEVIINWGDGSEETVANSGPWAHTYQTPGVYEATLRMTNSLGCSDTSYAQVITVSTVDGAALDFTADVSELCIGDTITLTNTSTTTLEGIKFLVEGGDSHSCEGEDPVRIAITEQIAGTTLELKMYGINGGCIDSTQQSVNFPASPEARLSYNIDCDSSYVVTFYNRSRQSDNDSIFITGLGASTYDTSFVVTDSVNITFRDRGSYRAVLEANNAALSCPSTADSTDFFITEPIASFIVDSIQCAGLPLRLDASPSQDVNACCYLGYHYEFSFASPFTTSSSLIDGDTLVSNGSGLQDITLLVTDINGCSDDTTKQIRVFGNRPSITASDDRICFPASVDFTSTVTADTTIRDYAWTFGTTGNSTNANTTQVFSNPPFVPGDPIQVTLMTTDVLNCPGQTTITLETYEVASSIRTIPDATICAGGEITFIAEDFTDEGSSLRFDWDFGNMQTSQNIQQTVTYTDAGVFDVTLDYEELGSGCSGQETVQVTALDKPNANFTSDPAFGAEVCAGLFTFTDATNSDPDTYTPFWFFNNSPGVGDTYVAALERGQATITLTAVSIGSNAQLSCDSTITRTVDVIGPEADFVFAPTLICPGQEVTFQLVDTIDLDAWRWDFGTGVTIENEDPVTFTYVNRPPGDSTVVSLSYDGPSGCSGGTSRTLRFEEVIADFATASGDLFACTPDVSFLDLSTNASTYLYDFGGTGTSMDANPDFTFPGPGVYEVTLEVENSAGTCRDTALLDITVLEPLALSVPSDTICPGTSTTLPITAARPLENIIVSPTNVVASFTNSSFTTVLLDETVDLAVTVQDSFGCTEMIDDAMIVVPVPLEPRFDTVTILRGASTVLEVENTGGFGFSWTSNPPDSAGICADCSNPEVSPEITTDYFLKSELFAGGVFCDSTILSFHVIVASEPIVPNLFTPNGDGNNDDWGPLFPVEVEPTVRTYRVYNRWGALVFEGGNASDRWLGDNNGDGTDLPSDVYAYVIELDYGQGDVFYSAGEVTLLR